jgi:serine/threonine protein kinase
MAIVYRARDVASGTVVALKRCLLPADTPDADAAARREADLHKRLSDHPNIVTLYGREIHEVGLYKLNAVDPQLESAWFQPLSL